MMLTANWRVIITVSGLLILAGVLALSLNPQPPNLTSDSHYQEESPDYRAGGTNCHPFTAERLSVRERARRTVACKEAEEEHRLKRNDLMQQRRSADAANAMAILSYEQTRIAAWGVALGFITMAAAIAAAFYARGAALETRRSNEFLVGINELTLHIEPPELTFHDGVLEGEFSLRIYGAVKAYFEKCEFVLFTSRQGLLLDEDRTTFEVDSLPSQLRHRHPLGFRFNQEEGEALEAGELDVVLEFEIKYRSALETVSRTYRTTYKITDLNEEKVQVTAISAKRARELIGKA